jgi:hypothetical protein
MPETFKRTAAAAAVTAITAAALAGCSSTAEPLTYAPAAYGVAGHCYYVDDPAEALALRAAGLCPASWAPALMPVSWHEEYWDYYDSPAYYDTYVPARVRTVYVHREASFGKTYKAAITVQSKKATYKSSAGTVVKGTKLTGKTRFGSGTSFGTSKYGGGSLRSSGSSKSGSTGSGSSRSGSTGSVSSRSGSLRSGSSGSRSSGSHR